jgi:hypothetical protein
MGNETLLVRLLVQMVELFRDRPHGAARPTSTLNARQHL